MSWIWHPVWGTIWISKPKAAGKPGDKHEVIPDVIKAGKATLRPGHKKTGGRNKGGEKVITAKNDPGTGNAKPVKPHNPEVNSGVYEEKPEGSINNNFNEISPGIFQFKRGIASLRRQQVNGTVSAGLIPSAQGRLPSNLNKFQQSGVTGDGVPIYTFT